MKKVGERIREQRELKGLLLRQVAAKLDMDQAILSKIERGERRATKEQVVALADFFEMDLKELQIQFLSEKIMSEYGSEDHFLETLKSIIGHNKQDELKNID